MLSAAAIGALSGCASFVQEVSEFQRGWRTAKVEAIGKAADLPFRALTDCRTTANAAELASSRFALLTYRMVGGRQHLHIVILDELTAVSLGDMVYTNVLHCGSSLKVRSSRQQDSATEAQASLSTLLKAYP